MVPYICIFSTANTCIKSYFWIVSVCISAFYCTSAEMSDRWYILCRIDVIFKIYMYPDTKQDNKNTGTVTNFSLLCLVNCLWYYTVQSAIIKHTNDYFIYALLKIIITVATTIFKLFIYY